MNHGDPNRATDVKTSKLISRVETRGQPETPWPYVSFRLPDIEIYHRTIR